MKGGRRSTTWKPAWKSGKTMVIRVPEVLVSELMQIARHLDNGGKVSLDAGNPHKVKSRPPKSQKAKRATRKEKEQLVMEAKRREIAFNNFHTNWKLFFPKKPFPEEDAEAVYQRFLEGKIEGMERVGRGDTLPLASVPSWIATTFWELKKMHEET